MLHKIHTIDPDPLQIAENLLMAVRTGAPVEDLISTLAVLGAALLTLMSEGLTSLLQMVGWEAPGLKQILYGLALGLCIMFMPHGMWPALARRWGFTREAAEADEEPTR